MSNIHRLEVKPRLTRHKYKRHDITVTYIPKDREWKWSFTETKAMTFGGREASADAALSAAKMQVDYIEGVGTAHA